MIFLKKFIFVAIFFAMGESNLIANDKLSISAAVDFSKGNYAKTTQTEMTATIIQTKYTNNAFSVQFDLPYLMLSKSNGHSEGIGDAIIGGTYNAFYYPELAFAVDIGLKLKLPTANKDDGLGTGELDELLQLYAYKRVDDFTLMLGAGYKWMGQPENVSYRNVISGSVGVIYQLSERAAIGTLVDFRQSVISTLQNQMEMTLYHAYNLTASWRTQLYVYKGVTETSPSIGLGGSLSYQF